MRHLVILAALLIVAYTARAAGVSTYGREPARRKLYPEARGTYPNIRLSLPNTRASQPEKKTGKPNVVRKRGPGPSRIRGKLKQRVDITFSDIEVTDAIKTLNRLTKANIVVDARALAEIERRGSPKVNIRLKDVPLESALAAIVRGAGLNYAVYNNFIYVSTPYRIRHEPLVNPTSRTIRMKSGASESLPKIVVRNPASGPYPVR